MYKLKEFQTIILKPARQFCIFQVKGHKAVYQFLSIPYETEGCDQGANASCKTGIPGMVDFPEHSLKDFRAVTSDCSERLTNHHGISVNYPQNTKYNPERAVDNREDTEDSFDELNEDSSRAESSSESSSLSDSNMKGLDELQTYIVNNNVFDNITENMDFVSNDDSRVDIIPEDTFHID